MKRKKQENQTEGPRQRPPSGAGRAGPARTSRRWISLAAVLGSIALFSGAIYFLTRPETRGSAPKGESPTGPPADLAAGANSTPPAGLAPESAPSGSNWDAINAGQQTNRAAADLVTRANALLASGDPKSAVRVLEEALRLTPDDENLHYNLGIAYGRSGDITNAEYHYREALRLLPDYPEVHNNLGNLLLHAKRLGQAEEQFTEAIKLMPELSTAHNSLGIVRQSQHRLPDAIACFRKAIEYNTNYWQAHFNLAIASLSQGSKEEGFQELQTVLRLNPGYKPAQRALDRIQAKTPGQGP